MKRCAFYHRNGMILQLYDSKTIHIRLNFNIYLPSSSSAAKALSQNLPQKKEHKQAIITYVYEEVQSCPPYQVKP
jgi:hypothetical protein